MTAGQGPREPRVRVRLVGGILEPLGMHGVGGLTGLFRQPLDALSQIGKPPGGHRPDRFGDAGGVGERQSPEEAGSGAAVVIHRITQRDSE